MEYKILEAPGVEIDNTDDSLFNNFLLSSRSGIIPEVLDECKVFSPSSNIVSISTGELIIRGFRIKILSNYSYTFNSASASTVEYHLVAKITLNSDKTVLFDIVCREVQSLQKDDLYQIGFGVYEFELAKFKYTNTSITNLVRVASVLNPSIFSSGPSSSGSSEIYVGSDTPPDNATVWIDTRSGATPTEQWEFEMEDGTMVAKTVVVTESEEL